MRLYKIEITEHPAMVWVADELVLADPVARKEWDHAWEGKPFFLPSERKLYRSRSSARDKQLAVERWGGKAILLEAEVGDFVPVKVANLRRKAAGLDQRAEAAYEQYEEACAAISDLRGQIDEELKVWRGGDDEHDC